MSTLKKKNTKYYSQRTEPNVMLWKVEPNGTVWFIGQNEDDAWTMAVSTHKELEDDSANVCKVTKNWAMAHFPNVKFSR